MMKYLTKPIGIVLAVILVLCIGGVIEKYRVERLVEASYMKGKADAMAKVLSDTQKLSQTLSAQLSVEFDKHNEYIMQSISEERIQRNEVAKLLTTGVYVNGNCHELNGIGLLNDKIRSRYLTPNTSTVTK
nr:MAG TPA: hypothetical protein [Caudoviricetes sp.]